MLEKAEVAKAWEILLEPDLGNASVGRPKQILIMSFFFGVPMKSRHFLFLNIILTIIRIALLITGFVFLNIYISQNQTGSASSITYIVFLSICVSFWVLIMILNLIQTILDINNNILNIGMWVLALSFESFILLKQEEKFDFETDFHEGWANTKEIAMTSIFLALFWVFSVINKFIPSLPFGVSISVKFIPLFASTIFLRFRYSFILCLIAAVSSLMFGPTVVAFGQWMLEYFLVLLVPCIGSLFQVSKTSKMNNINSVILICTIPWMLIFVFRVMASAIYWFKYAWDGYNIVLFSLIFNIPNAMVDYVVCLMLVPIFLKLKQHIKTK